jgi:hypothetical protein
MSNRRMPIWVFIVSVFLCFGSAVNAQTAAPATPKQIYDSLRSFQLGGGMRAVENLVLKRDRAEITFVSGTLYFALPVAGRVEGAVFIGDGKFSALPPPVKFEKENVKRMLHADSIESDFKTAVLRFTDDTFSVIGSGSGAGAATGDAQKLAAEFEARALKETGANIAARLMVSVVNNEQPGFFMAEFDKGKRGRFAFLMDPQERIPSEAFEINGGEKGLLYGYNTLYQAPEVWTAFYSEDDYARKSVEYSDISDQVMIRRHDMDFDAHDPSKWLRYDDRIDVEVLQDGLRAIQFTLNENLGVYNDARLKRALRVKSVKSADGQPVEVVQEDWDSSVTLLLPAPVSRGQKLTFTFRLEGEHMIGAGLNLGCFFPLTDSWYLRHGYLQRSTYRMVFHHLKRDTPVTLGTMVHTGSDNDTSNVVTEWKMDTPAPFINFAVGNYKRYDTTTKIGDRTIPISFYELVGGLVPVQADFVAAEMGNALRYYSALFGPYTYDNLKAAYQFRAYGQGMATFLLLPRAELADKFTFVFISHEVAHQWWGNMVAWRSYRDQWLSEGFAEYCAMLYTGQRDNGKSRQFLIDREREALRQPPVGMSAGVQKGKLTDLGPIILGHRLSTSETVNAYNTLIYDKGAMILRMVHFLFTDPATLDDKPFFDMMRDFVQQNLGKAVSTEDFAAFASQRFGATAIGRKYNITNLNWFFQQWVYSAHMPSYRLEYHVENQPGGGALLTGNLFQEDLPDDEKWVMPLPLVFTFGKDKVARGTIVANGTKTAISIKLPAVPDKVELDPDMMVLSTKTSVQKEH